MNSDVASDLEKQKKYKTIYNFLGNDDANTAF